MTYCLDSTCHVYRVLFQLALLAAADLNTLSGKAYRVTGYENLSKETFNIRDKAQNVNVYFMTYALYALTGHESTTLLTATLLQSLAELTFSTFFQHYVSSNISSQDGG